MDYHAIHGHDVVSFDLPSTHRLPTVSAAQALEEFHGSELNSVPTGLAALDAALNPGLTGGGVQKGHVTEIWGPPGVGKTAFGIQLAANCLNKGKGIVWVDGFHRLPTQRLQAAVSSVQSSSDIATDVENEQLTPANKLALLTHYTCPTLPHLIALLCRPTAACIPRTTSLVVVDALSALLSHAFPKTQEPRGAAANARGNTPKGPSQSARRLQVIQYIISSLQKLAATRDVAIVVLTECATKMQAGRGATLVPAINATVWEQGVSTRLVLFRDWVQVDERAADATRSVRFAAIQKLNGKGVALMQQQTPSGALLSTPAPKRKLDDTNFEIADSEDDEDYGWQDDDEEVLPPNPSQWQGSEDLLLGQVPAGSDDETGSSPDGQAVEALGDEGQESEVGDDGRNHVPAA
ncbi:P-loop containing nucleoside triphosphate hydrolase protein [Bombardia bombarda]|uniref:P-loop containing nucleoside triphosphate hydrolase protein n=1 Tax=Bombardia bombarda TaxID=252184 RepID=A0AA39XN65_9PEZI|nr:P-loop containing nucleoside triphosphate hydrolase protein [Bombardia bombarda]